MRKALIKAPVGLPQRRLRVYLQPARNIDQGKDYLDYLVPFILQILYSLREEALLPVKSMF